MGEFWVEVEMEDLASFDEDLSDCLYKMPTENLQLVSLTCYLSLFFYVNLLLDKIFYWIKSKFIVSYPLL